MTVFYRIYTISGYFVYLLGILYKCSGYINLLFFICASYRPLLADFLNKGIGRAQVGPGALNKGKPSSFTGEMVDFQITPQVKTPVSHDFVSIDPGVQ